MLKFFRKLFGISQNPYKSVKRPVVVAQTIKAPVKPYRNPPVVVTEKIKAPAKKKSANKKSANKVFFSIKMPTKREAFALIKGNNRTTDVSVWRVTEDQGAGFNRVYTTIKSEVEGMTDLDGTKISTKFLSGKYLRFRKGTVLRIEGPNRFVIIG